MPPLEALYETLSIAGARKVNSESLSVQRTLGPILPTWTAPKAHHLHLLRFSRPHSPNVQCLRVVALQTFLRPLLSVEEKRECSYCPCFTCSRDKSWPSWPIFRNTVRQCIFLCTVAASWCPFLQGKSQGICFAKWFLQFLQNELLQSIYFVKIFCNNIGRNSSR